MENSQNQSPKENQLRAVSELLYKFGQKIFEDEHPTLIKIRAMADKEAEVLCNIMNAYTTATLISMHTATKEALLKSMVRVLEDSGKAVLLQFRESVKA